MPFTFEKLLVYQKAVDFADAVCAHTEAFPGGYRLLSTGASRIVHRSIVTSSTWRFQLTTRIVLACMPFAAGSLVLFGCGTKEGASQQGFNGRGSCSGRAGRRRGDPGDGDNSGGHTVLTFNNACQTGTAPVRLDPAQRLVRPVRVRPSPVPANHESVHERSATGTACHLLQLPDVRNLDLAGQIVDLISGEARPGRFAVRLPCTMLLHIDTSAGRVQRRIDHRIE